MGRAPLRRGPSRASGGVAGARPRHHPHRVTTRRAGLAGLAGARSGLLGDDDLDDAAGVLEPGTVGVVLVYENTWAIPFATAALGEGGQMVATSRLTVQEIMDALDAVESAD